MNRRSLKLDRFRLLGLHVARLEFSTMRAQRWKLDSSVGRRASIRENKQTWTNLFIDREEILSTKLTDRSLFRCEYSPGENDANWHKHIRTNQWVKKGFEDHHSYEWYVEWRRGLLSGSQILFRDLEHLGNLQHKFFETVGVRRDGIPGRSLAHVGSLRIVVRVTYTAYMASEQLLHPDCAELSSPTRLSPNFWRIRLYRSRYYDIRFRSKETPKRVTVSKNHSDWMESGWFQRSSTERGRRRKN